ncbi:MAG: acyltransferase [Novosphingobium sp.]|nr:acyltransferase [Novosphingobium sp.]
MSDPSHPSGRGAFAWIDAMRFIAAALVVMEHARDLLFVTLREAGGVSPVWQAFYFLTGFGSEAVIAFFVISGFWITAAVERRFGAPDFWRGYLIDRLSRLLIVMVPALAVGAVLDLAAIHLLASPYALGTSGAMTLQTPVTDRLGLGVLLGNLVFLQDLVVPTFGSNGPLWSLANEFWYYLWFPSLLLALRSRRFGLGLLTLSVGLLSGELVKGFGVWLMGSALFYLDRRIRGASGTGKGQAVGLIGLCVAIAVMAAVYGGSRLGWGGLGHSFVLGSAFALVLWAVLRLDPALPVWLRSMATYGARASFSLYAAHFPFLLLVVSLLPPAARTQPDGPRALLWIAVLALTLGWGWLFARVTEARTGALRGWIRGRAGATTAPAAIPPQ